MIPGVLRAIRFACVKHAGQVRKNEAADPYVVHPIEVAEILAKAGITDEWILKAAVLHDVLEDTNTTYEEISAAFGKAVAKIVRDVTDDRSLSKVERKKAQVEHAKSMPCGSFLVKVADKISNLRSFQDSVPKGWSKETVYGYFVWSAAVLHAGSTQENIMMAGMYELTDMFYRCYGVTLSLPNGESVVIPPYDEINIDEDLPKYYALFSTKE